MSEVIYWWDKHLWEEARVSAGLELFMDREDEILR